MPQYLYKCDGCGKEVSINHGMTSVITFRCIDCSLPMHKVPQPVLVTWNGPKPSAGGVSDYMQNLIADAPRRRDEMAQKKEMQS